jgi:hypothetical protein
MLAMSYRQEKKMLENIGYSIVADLSVPVARRIDNWRKYLREYRQEKTKIMMKLFKEINGFEATDDNAKRALIDELHVEIFKRLPKDDDERNQYTWSRETPMMKIGWRPQ